MTSEITDIIRKCFWTFISLVFGSTTIKKEIIKKWKKKNSMLVIFASEAVCFFHKVFIVKKGGALVHCKNVL